MPWWAWLLLWCVVSVPASMLAGEWLRYCRLRAEQIEREEQELLDTIIDRDIESDPLDPPAR